MFFHQKLTKKFLVISLSAAIISLFCSSLAIAYVDEIDVFKDPKTGRFVFIFGDVHNLGSRYKNFEQMDFFLTQFIDQSVNLKVPVRILNEDFFFVSSERHQVSCARTPTG